MVSVDGRREKSNVNRERRAFTHKTLENVPSVPGFPVSSGFPGFRFPPGFPTTALSLIYVEPLTDIPSTEFDLVMSDSGFALNFMATRKKVELKAETLIPELLRKARGIYERSKPPAGREGCRDCELLERLVGVARS